MTTQVSDSLRATRAVVVGMSRATGLAVVRALADAGVVCHAVHTGAAVPGLSWLRHSGRTVPGRSSPPLACCA